MIAVSVFAAHDLIQLAAHNRNKYLDQYLNRPETAKKYFGAMKQVLREKT